MKRLKMALRNVCLMNLAFFVVLPDCMKKIFFPTSANCFIGVFQQELSLSGYTVLPIALPACLPALPIIFLIAPYCCTHILHVENNVTPPPLWALLSISF